MELIFVINKHKNKILNVAIIILAFIIATRIHNYQTKKIILLKQKEEIEIQKNAILKNISQLEKRIDSYKKLLIQQDTSTVINTISSIAIQSGVEIESIKPAREQAYPDYTKFSFELTLRVPSYHALGKFISRIESYQNVYIIENIQIRSDYGAASQLSQKELIVNLTVNNIVFTK